jgi:hypothetical protein
MVFDVIGKEEEKEWNQGQVSINQSCWHIVYISGIWSELAACLELHCHTGSSHLLAGGAWTKSTQKKM